MARDHLSAKDLAVCLGMSPHNAGKATDAAMERIAPIFLDHPADAHRMLADAIDKARAERPPLFDRRQRAIAQGVALEPLTEAEYYDMVARRLGRADLPGSQAKGRNRGATARRTAPVPEPDLDRSRRREPDRVPAGDGR